MGKKKEITVRDVIKQNLSKYNFPLIEISFGCIEVELNIMRENNDILCFSFEFGKDILEQMLNENVEKFEFYPNAGVPGGYDTSRLRIVVKKEEAGFIKI